MTGGATQQYPMMSEESQLVFEEESNLEDSESSVCRRRCPRVLLVFLAIYVVILVLFLTVAVLIRKESARPHVILILADDLGWGDVQWNDPDMRTPVLQDLLENGVLLNNSYGHPLDSPSRAALFTGMYPYHMGLQHETMDPYTQTYIPDNFTLLPSRLQALGYKTHMVGKWHLGFCDWKYTPTGRGFGSFAGFFTEGLDYFTHKDEKGYYDFRAGEMIDLHAEGTHSMHVLTDRADYLIRNHDRTVPLFLVLSFQAVHSPVQVPEAYLNSSTCAHLLNDTARHKLCALVAMMDEAIGNVTSVLRDKEMLGASVVIVTSDNGGVTSQGSRNGPFRGENGDLYEGGTHLVTLMSSPSLLSGVHGTTYPGLFHQVDWVPTILSIAGAPPNAAKGVDGVNQWHAVRSGGSSPRREIVYNIDDYYNHVALRVDNFKLMEGPTTFIHHPQGQRQPEHGHDHDHSSLLQLYDLGSDRGESRNLAEAMPDKVASLRERAKQLRKGLVPSGAEKEADPKADPALWDGFWSPGWC
ncbi:arylsulfatase I-like [Babylonia areolata]|uniref:arylsulfatase I-like n=1 Tax=Babylonia areolata TaxID=304850 RepID=UPI003FD6B860